MTDRTCTDDGCKEPIRARSLCAKHYRRDYHLRNRERALAQMSEYRATHREELTAWRADWYRNGGREKNIASARAWDVAHPEEAEARKAAHYAANRERYYRAARRWIVENHDRFLILNREKERRRGARKGDARVDYGAILAEYGMVCHICGAAIPSLADLHFDHVIPLARGGAHSADNIRPAHAFCNLSKGSRLL